MLAVVAPSRAIAVREPAPNTAPPRWVLAATLLLVAGLALASSEAEHWLLVDTGQLTLAVMQGDRPLLTLHGIAIGRSGTSNEKHRGDNTTPLGRFRINRIDRDSGFHRFIGVDYPDATRAERALWSGDISRDQYRAIVLAHRRGATPPQATLLGGHIGIHGLGQADPRLHEMANWTKGCVAVSNAQIDSLLLWVRIGMMVEIR
jgi:murein L,D-transpeptidase YafK